MFYHSGPPPGDRRRGPSAYAELHCHSHFSFLDGASAPDDLVARAVELGLAGLAITDHQGLYGAVRFSAAAEAAGLHPVIGIEIELLDAAVADPGGIVVPARRAWRPGRRAPVVPEPPRVLEGRPARPRPDRARLPGHREVRKEDHRGIGESQRGPHLVLLARDATGWRSLCRLVSRANLGGHEGRPEVHPGAARGARGGPGRAVGVPARGAGPAAAGRGPRGRAGRGGAVRGAVRSGTGARSGSSSRTGSSSRGGAADAGFVLELSHHLLPDDDWLASETARLAAELGLPVVVTNDVHYALPEGRELQDVLTAIRHGRSLADLADLRRPDGESYLKGAPELLALPPGDDATAASDPVLAAAWREGIANSADIASACRVELTFERYRFPGFTVPKGQTPFSHLSELCWEGARRRYHPLTPAVVRQLAHELDVIERTGLAEFFLICWDLMRFAKSRGIPAQGRGSAAGSIVTYVLGIARVDPIRHELLFERFINEGRTAYPDVDIDFSSERREEVIQYVYGKYGPEHTGMVCNLVTYRARSAVREVGYALGFPRPLVDRVAKALETYDSVMVRRDLEAEGGFGGFFARPGEGPGEIPRDAVRGSRRVAAELAVAGAAALAGERGLTDAMGQLNHERGGRIGTDPAAEHGNGRMPRRGDAPLGFAAGSEAPRLAEESNGDPSSVARARNRPESSPPTLIDPGSDPVASRDSEAPTRTPGATPSPRLTPESVEGVARGAHAQFVQESGRPTLPVPRNDSWVGHRAAADQGRGGNGTWEGAPGSAPAIRPGGPGDDEGGPGDSPASVAWLRAGRGTGSSAPCPEAGAPEGPGAGEGPCPPRGLGRAAPGLGALAGAVRPHRRFPPPPLHPQRRHARDRGAAHRHRPHRARDHARPGRRPVRQARRRDDEADQARPAGPRDAGRHRRDRPADRARLRRLPGPGPHPRGDPGGLRDAPGGGHGRRVPGGEPGPDADAAEVEAAEPGRPGRGGRDHPPRPHPGQRRPPVPAPQAGPGAGHVPPPEPGADPPRHPRRDPVPGAGDADRHRRGGLHAGGLGRVPAGDGDVPQRARDGEAPRGVRGRLRAAPRDAARRRGGAVPPVRRLRQLRLRQEPRRGVRPDGLRIELPQAVLPGPVRDGPRQRPADGLLPGRGPRQRRQAPRRGGPAGGRQPERVPDDDRVGRPAGLGAGGGRRATTARTTPTRASRCPTGAASTPGPRPCARPRA